MRREMANMTMPNVEMSMCNVMYQTSLTQFLELFMSSMDKAEKAALASKRVANIIETIEGIRAELPALQAILPGSVALDVAMDNQRGDFEKNAKKVRGRVINEAMD